MMEAMIPSQVAMSLRTSQKIKEAKKPTNKIMKNEIKERSLTLLSIFHTRASKQHHDLHDRESPMLSLTGNNNKLYTNFGDREHIRKFSTTMSMACKRSVRSEAWQRKKNVLLSYMLKNLKIYNRSMHSRDFFAKYKLYIILYA